MRPSSTAPLAAIGARRLDGAVIAFAGGAFCGALLLFALEPMFVKMALPRLGGSSEVWTACVLCYQCMLLGGYAYAHLLLRLRSVRLQALVHAALTVGALLALPPAIPAGWHPGSGTPAVLWLVGVLTVTVGLPFFVLSATSPLLGAWFARARPQHDPYALYAASNIGSLVALAAYPFVIEPLLGLHAQSALWSGGYVFFAACIGSCGFMLRSLPEAGPRTHEPAAAPIALERKLRWMFLAFVPSSVMLSVSAYLSERVAPIPLLWTLPLGIYLASFVVVFGTRAERIVAGANRALPIVLMPLVFMLCCRGAFPAQLEVPLHALVFAVIALVCHGALAAERPAPAHLTAFYLYVAVGGVLGGVLNGVAAPLVFPDVYEYTLGLVLAALAMPARDRSPRLVGDALAPLALLVATFVLFVFATRAGGTAGNIVAKLSIAAATLVCLTFAARPLRYALGIAVLVTVATVHATSGDLDLERNFYGVKRVYLAQGGVHGLVHGHTVHGAEQFTPGAERTPQTYYTRGGPLGDVFAALRPPLPAVAVVGLGAGSTACYRKPGADWTFYEIDPGMVAIARNRALFRYLADCAPDSPVIVGDARLSLQNAPPAAFDLMLFDAYASDAIPTHLLTREAVALYLTRLRPHGLLVFHISNAYFDFAPLIAALASDAGLVARTRVDEARHAPEVVFAPSQWMALARSRTDLGALANDPRWTAPRSALRLWTDDYSSIVTLLRRPGASARP